MDRRTVGWRTLKNIARWDDESTNAFIQRFEGVVIELSNMKVKMPESILAIQLLEGSKLTEAEKSNILTKTDLNNEEETLKTMKKAIIDLNGDLVADTDLAKPNMILMGNNSRSDRGNHQRGSFDRSRSRSQSGRSTSQDQYRNSKR